MEEKFLMMSCLRICASAAQRVDSAAKGISAQVMLRDWIPSMRCGTLPELRWRLEDDRRDRRSAGDRQDPQSSGRADPRPAAIPSTSSRSVPDNLTAELTAESRLPTQADGAARSDFDRAAR